MSYEVTRCCQGVNGLLEYDGDLQKILQNAPQLFRYTNSKRTLDKRFEEYARDRVPSLWAPAKVSRRLKRGIKLMERFGMIDIKHSATLNEFPSFGFTTIRADSDNPCRLDLENGDESRRNQTVPSLLSIDTSVSCQVMKSQTSNDSTTFGFLSRQPTLSNHPVPDSNDSTDYSNKQTVSGFDHTTGHQMPHEATRNFKIISELKNSGESRMNYSSDVCENSNANQLVQTGSYLGGSINQSRENKNSTDSIASEMNSERQRESNWGDLVHFAYPKDVDMRLNSDQQGGHPIENFICQTDADMKKFAANSEEKLLPTDIDMRDPTYTTFLNTESCAQSENSMTDANNNSPVKINLQNKFPKTEKQQSSTHYKQKCKREQSAPRRDFNIKEHQHNASKSNKRTKPETAGKFHGRTLLWGKEVGARDIPLEPLYKKHPFKRSGAAEVVPYDPRPMLSTPQQLYSNLKTLKYRSTEELEEIQRAKLLKKKEKLLSSLDSCVQKMQNQLQSETGKDLVPDYKPRMTDMDDGLSPLTCQAIIKKYDKQYFQTHHDYYGEKPAMTGSADLLKMEDSPIYQEHYKPPPLPHDHVLPVCSLPGLKDRITNDDMELESSWHEDSRDSTLSTASIRTAHCAEKNVAEKPLDHLLNLLGMKHGKVVGKSPENVSDLETEKKADYDILKVIREKVNIKKDIKVSEYVLSQPLDYDEMQTEVWNLLEKNTKTVTPSITLGCNTDVSSFVRTPEHATGSFMKDTTDAQTDIWNLLEQKTVIVSTNNQSAATRKTTENDVAYTKVVPISDQTENTSIKVASKIQNDSPINLSHPVNQADSPFHTKDKPDMNSLSAHDEATDANIKVSTDMQTDLKNIMAETKVKAMTQSLLSEKHTSAAAIKAITDVPAKFLDEQEDLEAKTVSLTTTTKNTRADTNEQVLEGEDETKVSDASNLPNHEIPSSERKGSVFSNLPSESEQSSNIKKKKIEGASNSPIVSRMQIEHTSSEKENMASLSTEHSQIDYPNDIHDIGTATDPSNCSGMAVTDVSSEQNATITACPTGVRYDCNLTKCWLKNDCAEETFIWSPGRQDLAKKAKPKAGSSDVVTFDAMETFLSHEVVDEVLKTCESMMDEEDPLLNLNSKDDMAADRNKNAVKTELPNSPNASICASHPTTPSMPLILFSNKRNQDEKKVKTTGDVVSEKDLAERNVAEPVKVVEKDGGKNVFAVKKVQRKQTGRVNHTEKEHSGKKAVQNRPSPAVPVVSPDSKLPSSSGKITNKITAPKSQIQKNVTKATSSAKEKDGKEREREKINVVKHSADKKGKPTKLNDQLKQKSVEESRATSSSSVNHVSSRKPSHPTLKVGNRKDLKISASLKDHEHLHYSLTSTKLLKQKTVKVDNVANLTKTISHQIVKHLKSPEPSRTGSSKKIKSWIADPFDFFSTEKKSLSMNIRNINTHSKSSNNRQESQKSMVKGSTVKSNLDKHKSSSIEGTHHDQPKLESAVMKDIRRSEHVKILKKHEHSESGRNKKESTGMDKTSNKHKSQGKSASHHSKIGRDDNRNRKSSHHRKHSSVHSTDKKAQEKFEESETGIKTSTSHKHDKKKTPSVTQMEMKHTVTPSENNQSPIELKIKSEKSTRNVSISGLALDSELNEAATGTFLPSRKNISKTSCEEHGNPEQDSSDCKDAKRDHNVLSENYSDIQDVKKVMMGALSRQAYQIRSHANIRSCHIHLVDMVKQFHYFMMKCPKKDANFILRSTYKKSKQAAVKYSRTVPVNKGKVKIEPDSFSIQIDTKRPRGRPPKKQHEYSKSSSLESCQSQLETNSMQRGLTDMKTISRGDAKLHTESVCAGKKSAANIEVISDQKIGMHEDIKFDPEYTDKMSKGCARTQAYHCLIGKKRPRGRPPKRQDDTGSPGYKICESEKTRDTQSTLPEVDNYANDDKQEIQEQISKNTVCKQFVQKLKKRMGLNSSIFTDESSDQSFVEGNSMSEGKETNITDIKPEDSNDGKLVHDGKSIDSEEPTGLGAPTDPEAPNEGRPDSDINANDIIKADVKIEEDINPYSAQGMCSDSPTLTHPDVLLKFTEKCVKMETEGPSLPKIKRPVQPVESILGKGSTHFMISEEENKTFENKMAGQREATIFDCRGVRKCNNVAMKRKISHAYPIDESMKAAEESHLSVPDRCEEDSVNTDFKSHSGINQNNYRISQTQKEERTKKRKLKANSVKIVPAIDKQVCCIPEVKLSTEKDNVPSMNLLPIVKKLPQDLNKTSCAETTEIYNLNIPEFVSDPKQTAKVSDDKQMMLPSASPSVEKQNIISVSSHDVFAEHVYTLKGVLNHGVEVVAIDNKDVESDGLMASNCQTPVISSSEDDGSSLLSACISLKNIMDLESDRASYSVKHTAGTEDVKCSTIVTSSSNNHCPNQAIRMEFSGKAVDCSDSVIDCSTKGNFADPKTDIDSPGMVLDLSKHATNFCVNLVQESPIDHSCKPILDSIYGQGKDFSLATSQTEPHGPDGDHLQNLQNVDENMHTNLHGAGDSTLKRDHWGIGGIYPISSGLGTPSQATSKSVPIASNVSGLPDKIAPAPQQSSVISKLTERNCWTWLEDIKQILKSPSSSMKAPIISPPSSIVQPLAGDKHSEFSNVTQIPIMSSHVQPSKAADDCKSSLSFEQPVDSPLDSAVPGTYMKDATDILDNDGTTSLMSPMSCYGYMTPVYQDLVTPQSHTSDHNRSCLRGSEYSENNSPGCIKLKLTRRNGTYSSIDISSSSDTPCSDRGSTSTPWRTHSRKKHKKHKRNYSLETPDNRLSTLDALSDSRKIEPLTEPLMDGKISQHDDEPLDLSRPPTRPGLFGRSNNPTTPSSLGIWRPFGDCDKVQSTSSSTLLTDVTSGSLPDVMSHKVMDLITPGHILSDYDNPADLFNISMANSTVGPSIGYMANTIVTPENNCLATSRMNLFNLIGSLALPDTGSCVSTVQHPATTAPARMCDMPWIDSTSLLTPGHGAPNGLSTTFYSPITPVSVGCTGIKSPALLQPSCSGAPSLSACLHHQHTDNTGSTLNAHEDLGITIEGHQDFSQCSARVGTAGYPGIDPGLYCRTTVTNTVDHSNSDTNTASDCEHISAGQVKTPTSAKKKSSFFGKFSTDKKSKKNETSDAVSATNVQIVSENVAAQSNESVCLEPKETVCELSLCAKTRENEIVQTRELLSSHQRNVTGVKPASYINITNDEPVTEMHDFIQTPIVNSVIDNIRTEHS